MKSFKVEYSARKTPNRERRIVKTGNFKCNHLSIRTPPATPINMIISIWKAIEE